MRINVRLFHRLREITGNTVLSEDIDENSTLRQLIDRIAEDQGVEFKKLLLNPKTNEPLPNVIILVNGRHNRFAGGLEKSLKEGDVVDLLTAIGGG
jgi:MoaD family protein